MTAVPQSRPKFRLTRPSLPVIIAAVLVIVLIASFFGQRLLQRQADPLAGGTVETVALGPLVAGINATGKIEPRQVAELAFTERTGRVSEVLVEEGASVASGDALVRLETRQLNAEVMAAEAALAQVQADLDGLTAGATKDQITEARAQLAAAQGALLQTQGNVTSADLRAAQAGVEEARARLTALQGQPNSDTFTSARTTLAETQANLDRQRSVLAAAKEDARRVVESRANDLRDAQAAFRLAQDNKQRVIDNGKDPITGMRLSDAGEQEYMNKAAAAERTMQDADATLAQARVDYDAARQNEITGLADAEAKLTNAQAALTTLINPNADDLAAARASLATAEANLARLNGDQRQGALSAQQANLEAAQARLDQLLADPKTSDLARAQARVAQANAQLELARIKLSETTLTAPFAGMVSEINVAPGEEVSQNSPVTLIDTTRYQVRVAVDEVDVAQVAAGQQVDVLIEALGAPALNGTVKRISAQALEGQNVTAYDVLIEIDPGNRPLRSGMTASAMIVTERHDGALSVPTRAVRTENNASIVKVVTTGTDGKQTVTDQPVKTGAQIGDRTEILSGITEGQKILLPAN